MSKNPRLHAALEHLARRVSGARSPSDARITAGPGHAYLSTRHIVASINIKTIQHVPVDLPWIRRGQLRGKSRPIARLSSSVTAFYRYVPTLPCVAAITDIVLSGGGSAIFSRSQYLRASGDRWPTSSADMGDLPLCDADLDVLLSDWYGAVHRVSNMAHQAWLVSPPRITAHSQSASGTHVWADGALVSVPRLVEMGFDYC